jgi:hypothetical protein
MMWENWMKSAGELQMEILDGSDKEEDDLQQHTKWILS